MWGLDVNTWGLKVNMRCWCKYVGLDVNKWGSDVNKWGLDVNKWGLDGNTWGLDVDVESSTVAVSEIDSNEFPLRPP